MNDGVPSPERRLLQPSPATSPNGGGAMKMPWESALYVAVAALEDRLAEARLHYAELQADLAVERAKLRECRGRLENWKLRQQAWQRERQELLKRLGEQ